MDINLLPDNSVVFKDIIAELSGKYKADLEHYQNEIADKDLYIHELEEQVRLLKALRYAARSEKARPASNELQYRLFDEAEVVSSQEESQDGDKDDDVTHVGPPHP